MSNFYVYTHTHTKLYKTYTYMHIYPNTMSSWYFLSSDKEMEALKDKTKSLKDLPKVTGVLGNRAQISTPV